MKLPKQSAPVMRTQAAVALQQREQGVVASIDPVTGALLTAAVPAMTTLAADLIPQLMGMLAESL